jgi:hypothetical protein
MHQTQQTEYIRTGQLLSRSSESLRNALRDECFEDDEVRRARDQVGCESEASGVVTQVFS